MREAVIVSTARTPIGKAYRGAFNDTQAQALGGHAIAHAVARAGIEPGQVDDVIMGAALQQASTGYNVARQAALRAGLPTSVGGMSLDRQCASGLMAIATAAKQIIVDGMAIAVGGGLESISLVQNDKMNRHRAQDPALQERVPHIYMSMLETAEIVAKRYGVTREAQDEYALQSQQRTAQAQIEGRFDAECARVHLSLFNMPFQVAMILDPEQELFGLYARPLGGEFFNAAFSVVRAHPSGADADHDAHRDEKKEDEMAVEGESKYGSIDRSVDR
jgi:acetyl-CoA C-acetyltransferase